MAIKAHTLARIFGRPLLVASRKLEVGLAVLGPRLGVDVSRVPSMNPEEPEAAPKDRMAVEVVDGIAVVQVIGTLGHRVSAMEASSGATSYETLSNEFKSLLADPRVEGVLLEVDSFGGEASGVFDLADVIRMVAGVKPVVGVANQFAMSAGYALLAQADQVFVPQTGSVGSVGVVTTHVDVTGAMAEAGVKVTHVHAGEHKCDLSPYRSLTPEAKSALEAEVAQVYDMFCEKAGRVPGRATAAKLRKTEAAIYTGEAAVKAGLANAVGGKDAAMAFLKAAVEDRRMDAKLISENMAFKAEVAALRTKLATFEAAETKRLEVEDAALLDRLQTGCAQAQVPISEERLALVKAAQARGDRAAAKELADGFLELAQAKAQAKAPLPPPAKTTPAAPAAGGSHAENVALGTQLLVEAAVRQGLLPAAK